MCVIKKIYKILIKYLLKYLFLVTQFKYPKSKIELIQTNIKTFWTHTMKLISVYGTPDNSSFILL